MTFLADGEIRRVIYFSNVSQILLGLVLKSNAPDGPIAVIHRRVSKGASFQVLSDELVLAAVERGVAKACVELGVLLHVHSVEYCSGDSGSAELYENLAAAITRRIVLGETFEVRTQATP